MYRPGCPFRTADGPPTHGAFAAPCRMARSGHSRCIPPTLALGAGMPRNRFSRILTGLSLAAVALAVAGSAVLGDLSLLDYSWN